MFLFFSEWWFIFGQFDRVEDRVNWDSIREFETIVERRDDFDDLERPQFSVREFL